MPTTTPSRVAVARPDDRCAGVRNAIGALSENPVKGRHVLIKPNFNTADPAPGSTHNDTLTALVDAVWDMGAASVSLGERSYRATAAVLKVLGSNAAITDRPIFAQRQIRRAAALGLGAASPEAVALAPANPASEDFCGRVAAVLAEG